MGKRNRRARENSNFTGFGRATRLETYGLFLVGVAVGVLGFWMIASESDSSITQLKTAVYELGGNVEGVEGNVLDIQGNLEDVFDVTLREVCWEIPEQWEQAMSTDDPSTPEDESVPGPKTVIAPAEIVCGPANERPEEYPIIEEK